MKQICFNNQRISTNALCTVLKFFNYNIENILYFPTLGYLIKVTIALSPWLAILNA